MSAAATVMSVQRDILAACYLIAPPTPTDLTQVIEQRTPGSSRRSC